VALSQDPPKSRWEDSHRGGQAQQSGRGRQVVGEGRFPIEAAVRSGVHQVIKLLVLVLVPSLGFANSMCSFAWSCRVSVFSSFARSMVSGHVWPLGIFLFPKWRCFLKLLQDLLSFLFSFSELHVKCCD
jgi:hypothetical protein